jgi:hypothetical protein|nr:MAG TPA: Avd-like-generating retroelement protein [Caudoviricetes sp.]
MKKDIELSKIYARQRTETLTGYVVLASKIRIEVLKLIKRETVLPKSLRFLVGKDITGHAESLEREAEHAYAWYPSDEMRLAERKKHLIEASASCIDLEHDMQMLFQLGTVKRGMDALQPLLDLLEQERTMLASQLSHAKTVKQK